MIDSKTKNAITGLEIARAITTPLAVAATHLAAHDPTMVSDATPMAHLATAVTTTMRGIAATRHGMEYGWKRGQADKRAIDRERAAATVAIARRPLGQEGRQRLTRDLIELASNQKTMAQPGSPQKPTDIRSKLADAFAEPGPRVKIDLDRIGVIASPNMKRALTSYSDGGREELVAAGLLRPDNTLDTKRDQTPDKAAGRFSRTRSRNDQGY